MGRAHLPPKLQAAWICREMKWDWHTYRRQPYPFLSILKSMLQNEAEEMERKQKNQKS
jgi:hypothetical protein